VTMVSLAGIWGLCNTFPTRSSCGVPDCPGTTLRTCAGGGVVTWADNLGSLRADSIWDRFGWFFAHDRARQNSGRTL
jgi:hypothetical protein